MIKHILLFKFRQNTPQDTIDKIMDLFKQCENKLSGLTKIEHGKNTSSKKHLDCGFNYCVIMHFEKKEDIDNYGLLTEHKQAQELQKPCVEKVLVFDIVV